MSNPGGGGGGGTVVVSNQFSIPKKTISSKTGSATFSVKLPGAGKLGVLGTAKVGKKTIKVGNVTLTVGKAGTYSVTLKPTGAAKQMLSKQGSLKVNLTLHLLADRRGGEEHEQRRDAEARQKRWLTPANGVRRPGARRSTSATSPAVRATLRHLQDVGSSKTRSTPC